MRLILSWKVIRAFVPLAFALLFSLQVQAEKRLLNVSYDPTRELYDEINAAFIAQWKTSSGETLTIDQSHGGSGKQARAVIEGLEADVVTLALARDIDQIALQSGKIDKAWQARLEHNSAPYTSTVVFLVRKGNPRGIRDWGDLAKPGIEVITPNPKTSGGARWNYLAAWSFALATYRNSEEEAAKFLEKLFANAPALDSGARGATTTFAERGLGDVLIAWENEALLTMKKRIGGDEFEIIYPATSIHAEPCVSVVDKVVDKKGTRAAAEAYLKFLYTEAGQQIAAKHYFRPVNAAVLARNRTTFPEIKLVTVAELGGWEALQQKHFIEGGLFDQISGVK